MITSWAIYSTYLFFGLKKGGFIDMI